MDLNSNNHPTSEDGSSGGDWIAKYYEAWVERLRANRPERTCKAYIGHVVRFMTLTGCKDPRRIGPAEVNQYLNMLPGRPSQTQALAAIRSYIAMATNGQRTINGQCLQIKKREVKPYRKHLTVEQRDAIIVAGRNEQERVWMSIERDTGARPDNIVNLDVSQCELAQTPYHIRIGMDKTKNGRPATPRLTHRTRDMLLVWLKGRTTGRVFPDLTNAQALEFVKRAGRVAGLTVTPYDFRHSRAYDFGELYRAGKVSASDVLNAFGWKDMNMFQSVYAQDRPEESLARLETVDRSLEAKPTTELDINKAMDLLSKKLISKEEFDALTGLVNRKKDPKDPMFS